MVPVMSLMTLTPDQCPHDDHHDYNHCGHDYNHCGHDYNDCDHHDYNDCNHQ